MSVKAHPVLQPSLLALNDSPHRRRRPARKGRAARRGSEHRYRTMLDRLPIGVYNRAPDGRFLEINQALIDLLGYPSRETLLAVDPAALYVDGQPYRAIAGLSAGGVLDFETQLRCCDGSLIWIRETVRAIADSTGTVTSYEGGIRDITPRRRAQEELEHAHVQLKASTTALECERRDTSLLAEVSDLLLACTTLDEAHDAIARGLSRLFPNASGGLFLIRASRDLVEPVASWGTTPLGEAAFAPGDCWALRQGRLRRTGAAGFLPMCTHLRNAPAGMDWCVPLIAQGEALGVLVIRFPGSEGEPGRDERLVTPIAQRISPTIVNLRLRETLRAQSIRDPLTGLFNRRYLEETMARELRRAERRGKSVGVLMLDLDRFKLCNDTSGHSAGDAILRELGAFLRSTTRAEDVACRYGGEEFVLLVTEIESDDLVRRAEELREGIKHLHVQHGGRGVGALSVSIGAALFPQHGATVETLLRVADAALYRAKAAGRDCAVLADGVSAAEAPSACSAHHQT
jgi:diguanylate cyclase (GGDEF)-like protein/PAS domain S-box-containing protein